MVFTGMGQMHKYRCTSCFKDTIQEIDLRWDNPFDFADKVECVHCGNTESNSYMGSA